MYIIFKIFQDYVWINPETKSEFDVPVAVKVLNSSGGKIQVKDDNGEVFTTAVTNVIKPLHSTSITSVEDMITLGELQEHTILRNLHIRYNQQLIYVSDFNFYHLQWPCRCFLSLVYNVITSRRLASPM